MGADQLHSCLLAKARRHLSGSEGKPVQASLRSVSAAQEEPDSLSLFDPPSTTSSSLAHSPSFKNRSSLAIHSLLPKYLSQTRSAAQEDGTRASVDPRPLSSSSRLGGASNPSFAAESLPHR